MTFLRIAALTSVLSSLFGMAVVPKPSSSALNTDTFQSSIPNTDVNPLGATFFLEKEVEDWKMEETLKMAKEAGIGWAKVHFAWEEIEPRKGYFWDDKYKKSTWDKYDHIVNLTAKYGMRVVARLDRPPAWTRKDNRLPTAPPDDLKDYGDFVQAVVSRYKGRVQYFQIWNEPNIWPEWGERGVHPDGYVEMLKLAYKRAKEANPNALVLSAPLAQTLERSERNLTELEYLDLMYKAGAKYHFDILAANAYGLDRPPSEPPSTDNLNFRRIQLLREVMVKNLDAEKAVWLNEFGWNASPPDFPAEGLLWRRVTENQQATYTTEAIKLARSWGWVGAINIWYFRQVGDIPTTLSDYYFRVVDPDLTPRPVFFSLKDLSDRFGVAGAGTHQETSAAVSPQGKWSIKLDGAAEGGSLLHTTEEGQELSFTFNGTKVSLVTQTGPDKGGFRVSVDGKDPTLPSREGKGPYVQPGSGGDGKRVVIPLTPSLPNGHHKVDLKTFRSPETPQAKEWVADAFVVDSSQALPVFWALATLGAFGVLAFGASLLLARRWR